MSSLGKRTIRTSVLLILSFLCLAVLLVPMLMLSRYDAPFADDFSFSCETHDAVESGESLFVVVHAACSKVRDVYFTWQGTFSGIFTMAFQPGIFGLRAYGATTIMMLTALIAGIVCFSSRFFADMLGLPKTVSGLTAAVMLIMCTQLVPNANQSFYWFNGAVYYTFMFGFTLLCYAFVIRYCVNGGCFKTIPIAVMAFIIGGSNFVTALETVILFFCTILFLAVKKNTRWKGLILPLIAVTAALIISALAPGNAVRQAEYPNSPNAITAVLLSFRTAIEYIIKWISLPYVGMLLFLVPVFAFSCRCSHVEFRYPLLVTVFSFCVFSSLFTPHLFAEGTPGPDRLINIVYFFFIILSVINLLWWTGWAVRKFGLPKRFSETSSDRLPIVPVLAGAALFLLCTASAVLTRSSSFTSVMAAGELRSGEAESYFSEVLSRQAVLEDSSIKDCEFSSYSVKPYLLFFGDMSEDSSDYTNEDTCTFYNKTSIKIIS